MRVRDPNDFELEDDRRERLVSLFTGDDWPVPRLLAVATVGFTEFDAAGAALFEVAPFVCERPCLDPER